MGEERASGSAGRMTTAEVESYLARIRETVRKSELLMEQAELRCRETDRLLASQGLTREDAEHLLDGVELPRAAGFPHPVATATVNTEQTAHFRIILFIV